MPDRKFKEIAEVSFLGPLEDQLHAQKRFITQAKQMGGNGVIFLVDQAGQKRWPDSISNHSVCIQR